SPATVHAITVLRSNAASRGPPRERLIGTTVTGTRTALATAFRQNPTARAGAAVAAISGPDQETASTATARSSQTPTPGRGGALTPSPPDCPAGVTPIFA